MRYYYGINPLDIVTARNYLVKKYGLGESVGFCEIKQGNDAFNVLLTKLKKNDSLVITAVPVLRGEEETVCDMMRKLRKLRKRGVSLEVVFDEQFSYRKYESWYSVERGMGRQNGAWFFNCYVRGDNADGWDFKKFIPDYKSRDWLFNENYAIWY